MKRTSRELLVVTLVGTALLASCGGGGRSATTPTLPDPDPSPVESPTPDTPAPAPIPEPAPEQTRTVSGTVVTTDAIPLPAALAHIGDLTAATDEAGHFTLIDIPADAVTLTIDAPGFAPSMQMLPAGEVITTKSYTVQLMPIADLGPVALDATSGLGGATLDVTLPGLNLPVDCFLYRREAGGSFDWDAPLNTIPLRQVELGPTGQANAVVPGAALRFRDADVIGGVDYTYTVRLRNRAGTFGPPQAEVPVRAAGFGPATDLTGIGSEVLLDTAPGADGSLIALYRDMSYKPWHRFIARRYDGRGTATQVFKVEGVFDDAQIYVDRYDIPFFLYRRNGIEFLFETYLFNYFDGYGLSPDLHLGEGFRKITDELAGNLHFRIDPEGTAPQELMGVYVNRDQNVIANVWDHAGFPRELQLTLGSAKTTLKPLLRSAINTQGDLLAVWNADYADSAYYRMAFVDNKTLTPDRYLASGQGMAVQLGVAADDQFVVAFTTEPEANVITLYRYQPNGDPTAAANIELNKEGATITSLRDRLAIATLPNGRTYLAAIVNPSAGGHELRAWDITDTKEPVALGNMQFTADSPVPGAMELNVDYNGHLHLVATENGRTVYRQLFWPGA